MCVCEFIVHIRVGVCIAVFVFIQLAASQVQYYRILKFELFFSTACNNAVHLWAHTHIYIYTFTYKQMPVCASMRVVFTAVTK